MLHDKLVKKIFKLKKYYNSQKQKSGVKAYLEYGYFYIMTVKMNFLLINILIICKSSRLGYKNCTHDLSESAF